MKNFSIFILLFPSIFLHGQFADNLEFLNHKESIYHTSLPLLFKDALYFVEHLQNRGGTKIYSLDQENNLEIVYETKLRSQAKIGYLSDSGFQIILENLVEWDVPTSGFISVTIDSIGSSEVFEYHRFMNTCNLSEDALVGYGGTAGYLDEDSWVYLSRTEDASSDSLYLISNECRITVLPFDGNSKGSLRNDENENLYLIFGTAEHTNISSLDTNFAETLLDTFSGSYRYVASNQLSSFFLYDWSKSSLLMYDPGNKEIVNEWQLGPSTTIRQVYSEGMNNFISVIDFEGSYVIKGLANGAVDTLTTFISEGFEEEYAGIFQGDDEEITYLGIFGKYPLKHSFIRNIETLDNDEGKYDRADFEICAFDVELTDWELDYVYETMDDTIELYFLDYEIDVEICNNSDATIYHTDLYIPNNSFIPLTQEILPGDSYVYSTETGFYGELGLNITLQSYGADYKFNKSIGLFSYLVATKEQNSDESSELTLYPNPTTGKIFYDAPPSYNSIEIFDSNGHHCGIFHNIEEGSLDLSHLGAGIYLLIFSDSHKEGATKKIVKY